jgi:sulfur carrier protein ThiS
MRIKVIIEQTLEEEEIDSEIRDFQELLNFLNLNIDNIVLVRNNKVVTNLNEKLEEGDEIRIIEAVGGG